MTERQELLATQALLQRGHDYYETVGFDISVYSQKDVTPRTAAKGRTGETKRPGPCCYIGGLRLAAGCIPTPQEFDDEGGYATDAGDGPELTLALKLADEAAEEIARSRRILGKVRNERKRSGKQPGALVEALGFYERRNPRADYSISSVDRQTEQALATMRHALTLVHKKLEALDAKAAA